MCKYRPFRTVFSHAFQLVLEADNWELALMHWHWSLDGDLWMIRPQIRNSRASSGFLDSSPVVKMGATNVSGIEGRSVMGKEKTREEVLLLPVTPFYPISAPRIFWKRLGTSRKITKYHVALSLSEVVLWSLQASFVKKNVNTATVHCFDSLNISR